METVAEEVDGGFIINGSKTWITNAPAAYVGSPEMILSLTLSNFPQRRIRYLGSLQVG